MPALHAVGIEIERGEFVALIGQNGSGKTTLAKQFNGLLKPSSGDVLVDGKSTRTCSIADLAKTVGYVFQNPDHQLCMKTVEEELKFGPRNFRLEEGEIERRAEELLEAFGLGKYRNTHPFLLSRADRLRVAFCSVLIMEPKLIVVDEPTTGQDMRQSHEVMRILEDLNRKGHTIVFITHNMKLVAEYSKRTVVMRQGLVTLDGATREVLCQHEKLAETYLKPPQITVLASKLSHFGIPREILTVEEMSEALDRRRKAEGLQIARAAESAPAHSR